MARPSTPPPSWATNAGTRDPSGAIPSGRQGTGWLTGESITAKGFNAILGQFADWIVYAATLLPADGIVGAVAFRVYDAIGGNLVGTVSHSAGDLTVIAEDGLLLQGSGAGTPGVYLDDAAGTVRLQSYAADAAVIIRAGWDLNDQDFRVGFGDNVGDGSGYPTYSWDLSPALGNNWLVNTATTSVGLGVYVTPDTGSGGDVGHMENQTGATDSLRGICTLTPALYVDEDGATFRHTVTELSVIFAADAGSATPTVQLIRMTRGGGGATTRVVMATCTCPASINREPVVDTTITSGDLDWGTYMYRLEWLESSIADGAVSRGVEQVIVRALTRAGA